MLNDGDYTITFFSKFDKAFKHNLKRYPHTFENDFQTVLKVITGRLKIANGNVKYIPGTDLIKDIGNPQPLPIIKIRLRIQEARDMVGRLIFLVCNEKMTIFLIDVYNKKEQQNHDKDLIKEAFSEFLISNSFSITK